MGYIRRTLYSEDFKNKSKLNEKDFTRKRKVGFVTLVCMILNMIKRSTQLEIDDFLNRFDPEDANCTAYTKQSFSEARQKLSPEAFKILNDGFIEKFYDDGCYKKFKGYRLLAIDASSIEVPNNKETQKVYGRIKNNSKELLMARAISSNVYDIENKILVSSILGRFHDSERDLAIRNIDKMNKPEQKIKNLILFDKGYPSLAFIKYLESKEVKFLIRVQPKHLKEIGSTKAKDENVEIEVTRQRSNEQRNQAYKIPVGTIIRLRVLKVVLGTGEVETLITNLNHEELKYEEGKELYFKRWGIETKFDELKNKFQIENFSGEKPLLIEQDFYASTLLCNIASIFEQDAQDEINEQNSKKELKYEYKINKNILIGKLKNRLIEILLEDNDEKKTGLYNQFIEEIRRNVVPVIKNRAFERTKLFQANRYSKNRRRAL